MLQINKLRLKEGQELSDVLSQQEVSRWELNLGLLMTSFILAPRPRGG